MSSAYHLYCFSPIEFSKSRFQSTVAKILRELNVTYLKGRPTKWMNSLKRKKFWTALSWPSMKRILQTKTKHDSLAWGKRILNIKISKYNDGFSAKLTLAQPTKRYTKQWKRAPVYFKEKTTVKTLSKFKMVKLDINISLYELFLSYNQIYFFFSEIIFCLFVLVVSVNHHQQQRCLKP